MTAAGSSRRRRRSGAIADAPLEVASLGLMLAGRAERPFSAAGWLFELKYDGFRVLAAKAAGEPSLWYRGGSAAGPSFPELIDALRSLPSRQVVLDGELVVADGEGRPSFPRLQQRFQLRRPSDVARARVEHPAALFLFDLLFLEGQDLREQPLVRRKALLRELLPSSGPLRFVDHVDERGEALYAEVRGRGLEGIVAKRADSAYQAGRSSQWLKLAVRLTAELAIVGISRPGEPGHEGGLQLGAYVGGALRYVGSVGSGVLPGTMAEARRLLDPLRRAEPPCTGALPRRGSVWWFEPRVVCEVEYKHLTREGLLRQPVFRRFRPDVAVEDCRLEDVPGEPDPAGFDQT